MTRTDIAARLGISKQLLHIWEKKGVIPRFELDPKETLRAGRAIMRAKKKGRSFQRIRLELAYERGKEAGANVGR